MAKLSIEELTSCSMSVVRVVVFELNNFARPKIVY